MDGDYLRAGEKPLETEPAAESWTEVSYLRNGIGHAAGRAGLGKHWRPL